MHREALRPQPAAEQSPPAPMASPKAEMSKATIMEGSSPTADCSSPQIPQAHED